jgi:hypothetical protein
MAFRVLFGMSCAFLPALIVLINEAIRQSIKGSLEIALLALPAFTLFLALFSHRRLNAMIQASGTDSFQIVKAEVDDAKFFDQMIRVASIGGVFLASRYLILDFGPQAVLFTHALRVVVSIVAEFLLFTLFIALCARSLSFHANGIYALVGTRIWRVDGIRISGGKPSNSVTLSFTVLGGRSGAIGKNEAVTLSEVIPSQVYGLTTKRENA